LLAALVNVLAAEYVEAAEALRLQESEKGQKLSSDQLNSHQYALPLVAHASDPNIVRRENLAPVAEGGSNEDAKSSASSSRRHSLKRTPSSLASSIANLPF